MLYISFDLQQQVSLKWTLKETFLIRLGLGSEKLYGVRAIRKETEEKKNKIVFNFTLTISNTISWLQ